MATRKLRIRRPQLTAFELAIVRRSTVSTLFDVVSIAKQRWTSFVVARQWRKPWSTNGSLRNIRESLA
jgi:hypothetical protein